MKATSGTLQEGQMQTFLGKMTAYQRAGKQVLRGTTPTSIINPQSALQMYQRLKFHNLNNFYHAVAPFTRGGWERRKPGSSAFNAFMAANLDRSPLGLTRAQKDAGMVIVAPYAISSGSLPAIRVDTATRNAAQGISDILVGDLTISSTTTVGALAEAIVDANGGRFEYGDEIAFLSLAQYVVDGIVRVRATRTAIVLVENSTETLSEVDLRGFGTANGCLAISGIAPEGGYCWVHARKDADGVNRVSTQVIIPVGTAIRRHFSQSSVLRAAAEDLGAEFADDVFLECTTTAMRRAFDAFGIRYRLVKKGTTSIALCPTVNYVEHASHLAFTGEQALMLDTSADTRCVITVADIDLIDTDSLAVEINGVECPNPTVLLNAITVTIPASESGKPLTSVTLTSDTGHTTATFTN